MPLKPHPTDPDKMVYASPHYDLPYTPTARDTTPPKQEPRNFCPRCGKRTPDLTTIHTCTPRPWVGLTDDEREKIKAATMDLHGIAKFFATAIEAKLKEKNT